LRLAVVSFGCITRSVGRQACHTFGFLSSPDDNQCNTVLKHPILFRRPFAQLFYLYREARRVLNSANHLAETNHPGSGSRSACGRLLRSRVDPFYWYRQFLSTLRGPATRSSGPEISRNEGFPFVCGAKDPGLEHERGPRHTAPL
jgi:hypothetical protein